MEKVASGSPGVESPRENYNYGVGASGSLQSNKTPATLNRFATLADNTHHNEGLCLLFKRRTEYHQVVIDGEKLAVKRKGGLSDSEWGKATKISKELSHRKNVLKNLPKAGIQYNMSYSQDENQTYVIVVIAMSHYKAEEWAQSHGLDCQIEPREAIKIGRQKTDFLLAHRTYLDDGKDDPQFTDEIIRHELKFDKLPLSFWDPIYITYETTLDRRLYRRFPPHNHVLDNRLYLNILYDALQSPRAVGGANFPLQKALRNGNHPLTAVFSIDMLTFNDEEKAYEISKPDLTTRQLWLPQSEEFWTKKVDDIRSYYGELVAFYFAFLRHYIIWSYYITGLGFIWFAGQMIYGNVFSDGKTVSLPGSTVGVGMAIAWGTLMSESWYRKEAWLRYKWGMMRYTTTEAPRAGFRGKLTVSPHTGELIETHESEWRHYAKIFCSFSGVFASISCVIGAVLGIWFLKSAIGDNTELTYGVAFANSVQIQIMNKIYTSVAVKLNDFEGHRLEQEYYNHLVVKRILFFVVNSYNSLFYIAFFRPDADYGNSNEKRLEAIRTQLIILFVTLTIFQNCWEILFPWAKARLMGKLTHYKSGKLLTRESTHKGITLAQKNANLKNNSGDGIRRVDTAMEQFDSDHESSGRDRMSSIADPSSYTPLIVTPAMWDDIEQQIDLPRSPDVLNNTAEIVIQYGYIMLFVFVFPIMPLLGLINNFLETRVDFQNLTNSRRPIPFAADGIGVWKKVISAGSVVAVFTNLTLITFRTDIITNFLGTSDTAQVLTFYFVVMICCLVLQFVARFMLDDEDKKTREAIGRQSECEKHFLLAAGISAEDVRNKHLQLAANWEDENESDFENELEVDNEDSRDGKYDDMESEKKEKELKELEKEKEKEKEREKDLGQQGRKKMRVAQSASADMENDDSIRTDSDHHSQHAENAGDVRIDVSNENNETGSAATEYHQ